MTIGACYIHDNRRYPLDKPSERVLCLLWVDPVAGHSARTDVINQLYVWRNGTWQPYDLSQYGYNVDDERVTHWLPVPRRLYAADEDIADDFE